MCKVSKAFVIDRPDIARRLSTDIVPLQGNWTMPDAKISSFMLGQELDGGLSRDSVLRDPEIPALATCGDVTIDG